MQKQACLDDLTTAGLVKSGHTDASDWAGLDSIQTMNPTGVPGLQVDGYFPDTSTDNAENGWFHDSQFVIRFPNNWNGKLVITGAPGIRKQYSTDPVISDFVLSLGYAYASTDKGNNGDLFYQDETAPGGAIQEWNYRVTQLTMATKQAVRLRYGRLPDRTYITGISNGGYLTRWQLENHPELYDGGVDWEGTLFTPNGPNLLTYLPTALKYFPAYRANGSQAAHDAMIKAGFAPGSEFLWNDHYTEYWDLTQRTYRQLFDPSYSGPFEAGIAFCQSGTPFCDADYDYAARPAAVHQAVASVSLTGHIGKPMLTLHGTLDSLLPIATDSDVYTKMIQQAGRGALSRYYVIQNGNHVDGRYDVYGPSKLRPIQPCWRAAFVAMTNWVEHGQAPPPSQFVRDPASGDVANDCTLAQSAAPPTGGAPVPSPATPCIATSRLTFRLNKVPHGRVVRVAAYVNGHRVLRRRGHNLTRISFARPPGRQLKVKIITTNNKGGRVVTMRTFRGCKRTKVTGRTHRHKKTRAHKRPKAVRQR